MSIKILKFRVGEAVFALAAGCVEAISAVRSDIPHLAWVLGRQVADFRVGSRALHVIANARRVEVIVDGPVELVDLVADDIAPCRTTTSSSILGFAHGSDGVFGLLDAARVVDLVETTMQDLA